MSNKNITITYLSSNWCGPCKQFFPVLEKFCKDFSIQLIKNDVYDNPELAAKYSIKSIPFMIISDGANERTASGVKSLPELTEFVKSLNIYK